MGFYNLILHLDSADPAMLKLVLRNARNYLNALPNEDFDLVIVANGGGAQLLAKKETDLHNLATPVIKDGVKIKICANAMKDHNLGKEDIWEECEIVPAGLVEIVRLQKNGYAYIKP